MKYGKTYSTLLSTATWPQEWRDLALDYRGLKKLLKGVVEELAAQGLNHEVLLDLLEAEREFEEHEALAGGDAHESSDPANQRPSLASFSRSRAHYEFTRATERERAKGESGIRDVVEAEKRLGMFASEIVKRGLGDRRTLKSAKSRDALQTFLNLNVHILDLKKFELANSEAARKILKKHEKRTALPSATSLSVLPISRGTGELPQMLITKLTETLLPVLPSLEDYSCLICTSIAFKPIRLACGHLFCVRCLVKMQKRGQGECPLCRAPCVLVADGSNLDVGLMNFMKEWFPKETKEKSDSNDRESAEEQLIEMGYNPGSCIIA
ncbi:hypothetical protein FRC11_007981 [Ceratobasidium sp. 423]|nr:hypothetical protein FRC11_007981 [Ceratobasidium sp. 423]